MYPVLVLSSLGYEASTMGSECEPGNAKGNVLPGESLWTSHSPLVRVSWMSLRAW